MDHVEAAPFCSAKEEKINDRATINDSLPPPLYHHIAAAAACRQRHRHRYRSRCRCRRPPTQPHWPSPTTPYLPPPPSPAPPPGHQRRYLHRRCRQPAIIAIPSLPPGPATAAAAVSPSSLPPGPTARTAATAVITTADDVAGAAWPPLPLVLLPTLQSPFQPCDACCRCHHRLHPPSSPAPPSSPSPPPPPTTALTDFHPVQGLTSHESFPILESIRIHSPHP